MAGVGKEIIWMDDYISDAVVLQLAYVSTTKEVMSLDTADIINHAVTIMSLVLMIL